MPACLLVLVTGFSSIVEKIATQAGFQRILPFPRRSELYARLFAFLGERKSWMFENLATTAPLTYPFAALNILLEQIFAGNKNLSLPL